MTSLAAEPGFLASTRLGALVRSELAPFPGRMNAVWRYLLVSALVIVISMTLQVPALGLSLMIVFFTARDNAPLTLTTCVFSVIGTTVAIGIALVLLKFTMGDPMLCLLGAAAILFCGIYFMRISKFGQLGYLAAIVICYSLTMLDVVNDPEFMTRFLLWVWVATVYPILITALVNLILLPAHPEHQLQDELLRQLDDVDRQLEARLAGSVPPPLSLDSIERGVLALYRHLSLATLADPAYRRDRGFHLMVITTVDRLRTAAVRLSRLPGTETAQSEWISGLRSACGDLRLTITENQPFAMDPALVADQMAEGPVDAVLQEMGHALNALAEAESMPHAAGAEAREGLVAADWLSNPVYGQFALKTVLAGLICYAFQAAVQWPGIHTAPQTCFIVALPSLGASSRRGTLRVIGCALGSMVTLLITVFLIPHLDTITGLLLLTMPVIAVGAWIAAGSERFSYIGLQFVFAFSLALFGRFAPSTNIPEIRDRMVGIVFGVTVSMLTYSLLWPEREGSELWAMLARLVRSIAGLARAGRDSGNEADQMRDIAAARKEGWSRLAANRDMESRVALEPGWQYAHDAVTVDLQTWFAQVQETLFSVHWLQTLLHHAGPELSAPLLNSCEQFREDSATRLDQLAERLDSRSPDTVPVSLSASLASFDLQCLLELNSTASPGRIEEIVSAVHAINERIAQLNAHFASGAEQTPGPR
jgi:multidrug resistance protein MdtO